jgi:hypothetical protein
MEDTVVNEEYVSGIKKHEAYMTATEEMCARRMVAYGQPCNLANNELYHFAKREFETGKEKIKQFVYGTMGVPVYANIQNYLKTLAKLDIDFELTREYSFEKHYFKQVIYCTLFPSENYRSHLSIFSLVGHDEKQAEKDKEKIDTLIAIFDNFPYMDIN